MTKESNILIKDAWDLEVFKRAYAISLAIHKAAKHFPKEEMFALTSQIRRASKSVCANLAEGFAKQEFSRAEFKRFVSMAIGSAAEMRIWIRYCLDLEYITKDIANSGRRNIVKLQKCFGGFMANNWSSGHPVIWSS